MPAPKMPEKDKWLDIDYGRYQNDDEYRSQVESMFDSEMDEEIREVADLEIELSGLPKGSKMAQPLKDKIQKLKFGIRERDAYADNPEGRVKRNPDTKELELITGGSMWEAYNRTRGLAAREQPKKPRGTEPAPAKPGTLPTITETTPQQPSTLSSPDTPKDSVPDTNSTGLSQKDAQKELGDTGTGPSKLPRGVLPPAPPPTATEPVEPEPTLPEALKTLNRVVQAELLTSRKIVNDKRTLEEAEKDRALKELLAKTKELPLAVRPELKPGAAQAVAGTPPPAPGPGEPADIPTEPAAPAPTSDELKSELAAMEKELALTEGKPTNPTRKAQIEALKTQIANKRTQITGLESTKEAAGEENLIKSMGKKKREFTDAEWEEASNREMEDIRKAQAAAKEAAAARAAGDMPPAGKATWSEEDILDPIDTQTAAAHHTAADAARLAESQLRNGIVPGYTWSEEDSAVPVSAPSAAPVQTIEGAAVEEPGADRAGGGGSSMDPGAGGLGKQPYGAGEDKNKPGALPKPAPGKIAGPGEEGFVGPPEEYSFEKSLYSQEGRQSIADELGRNGVPIAVREWIVKHFEALANAQYDLTPDNIITREEALQGAASAYTQWRTSEDSALTAKFDSSTKTFSDYMYDLSNKNPSTVTQEDMDKASELQRDYLTAYEDLQRFKLENSGLDPQDAQEEASRRTVRIQQRIVQRQKEYERVQDQLGNMNGVEPVRRPDESEEEFEKRMEAYKSSETKRILFGVFSALFVGIGTFGSSLAKVPNAALQIFEAQIAENLKREQMYHDSGDAIAKQITDLVGKKEQALPMALNSYYTALSKYNDSIAASLSPNDARYRQSMAIARTILDKNQQLHMMATAAITKDEHRDIQQSQRAQELALKGKMSTDTLKSRELDRKLKVQDQALQERNIAVKEATLGYARGKMPEPVRKKIEAYRKVFINTMAVSEVAPDFIASITQQGASAILGDLSPVMSRLADRLKVSGEWTDQVVGETLDALASWGVEESSKHANAPAVQAYVSRAMNLLSAYVLSRTGAASSDTERASLSLVSPNIFSKDLRVIKKQLADLSTEALQGAVQSLQSGRYEQQDMNSSYAIDNLRTDISDLQKSGIELSKADLGKIQRDLDADAEQSSRGTFRVPPAGGPSNKPAPSAGQGDLQAEADRMFKEAKKRNPNASDTAIRSALKKKFPKLPF